MPDYALQSDFTAAVASLQSQINTNSANATAALNAQQAQITAQVNELEELRTQLAGAGGGLDIQCKTLHASEEIVCLETIKGKVVQADESFRSGDAE